MNRNCNCHNDSWIQNRQCKSIANKSIDVNTPVRVEPRVEVGRIRTACQRPRIFFQPERRPNHRHACDFVIRQTINVEIPISYDVETNIGDSYVDCKQPFEMTGKSVIS